MLYNNYEALSDELNACLEEHNYLKLRSILKNVLPQDIAIFIDDIEPGAPSSSSFVEGCRRRCISPFTT